MVPKNVDFLRALIMISERELVDTLLLKSAVGNCLIHVLLSGSLTFASIAIPNVIHTLRGQEIPCT